MANRLYELKKAVLTPRTIYMRRKEADMDPIARQIFELSYYRKQAYEFVEATMYNPDILVDVPIDDSAVCFDVGAYIGGWSEKVWERYQPTIYAFEPAPSCYELVERKFADNPKVHPRPYGLGGSDMTARLGLSAAGSSIYEEGELGAAEIEIRDVVSVLDELGLERIEVLKVNIEGGEYDLLDRLAEAGWLGRIDHVLVQFHEWHPRSYQRRRANRRDLARTHDEVWGLSWIWEYWKRKGI